LRLRFPGTSEFLLARRDKDPIAGIHVMYGKNTAHYSYSGVVPGHEKDCPVQLLLWEAIKECHRRGIERFDLGEAREGSGVYQFKIWMGGQPKPVYYYDLPLDVPDQVRARPLTSRIHSRLVDLATRTESWALPHLPNALKAPLLERRKRQGRLL
jgi:hypothetical protein